MVGEDIPASLLVDLFTAEKTMGDSCIARDREITSIDWRVSEDAWNENWLPKGGHDGKSCPCISVSMSGDPTAERKVICETTKNSQTVRAGCW